MSGFALTKPLLAAVSAVALIAASAAAAAPTRSDSRGSPADLSLAAGAALPVVTLVPPPNDEIASATPIGALPFSDARSTLEATTAVDDPVCVANAVTVWYALTPATTAWIMADTAGSDYDTTLSAYTGSPGALTQVACNDDTGGNESRISFLAEAGVTYHLLVAGKSTGGNLVLSVGAAGPFAQIPVKTSTALEVTPAAAPGRFSWAQAPRGVRFWALMAEGPEGRRKVNRSRTHGFAGGFKDDTYVYQEVRGRQSNLQVYNLALGTRSGPPAGVNTRHWEWHPTISGDWLLFGRGNGAARTDSIFLRNVVTGRTILLDRRPWGTRRIAEPGQVAGNYAVWFRCTPRCDVIRYDIAAGTKTKIPNPNARQQYDPSVTSDGTVYFVRSRRGCGATVQLVRYPPGGPATVLAGFPAGRDSFHTFALEHTDGVSLFYERVRCAGRGADVLRIIDP